MNLVEPLATSWALAHRSRSDTEHKDESHRFLSGTVHLKRAWGIPPRLFPFWFAALRYITSKNLFDPYLLPS